MQIRKAFCITVQNILTKADICKVCLLHLANFSATLDCTTSIDLVFVEIGNVVRQNTSSKLYLDMICYIQ